MSQLIKAIILPAPELQVVANDNAFRCSGGPIKVRPKYGDTIWVADDTGKVSGHAKWVDCKRTQSGDLEWSLKSFAPVSQMKIDRRVIAEKIKGGERLVRLPGNCLINQTSTICVAFERNGKRSSESAASTDTWSEPKRPSIAEASDHSRQSSAASISAAPADLPHEPVVAEANDISTSASQQGECPIMHVESVVAETNGRPASVSEQVDVPAMDVEPVVADASDLFAPADENSKASEDVSADAKVTLLQYYK